MKLVIQQGPEAGRQIRLDRGILIIGRGQDCDLVLLDTQASRHHAELRRFGDGWLLVDLGSSNGTYVDGVRQAPDEARPLPPGVPVGIGDTILILEQDRAEPVPLAVDFTGPPAEPLAEAPYAGRQAGVGWEIAAWVARLLAGAGAVLLVAGSLADWIRVKVSVPLLGQVLDKTFSGPDSGQAYLFLGVAVVALLMIVLDVASARWGLAAGLGQALTAIAAGASVGLTAYRYYKMGDQRILGFNVLDLVEKYASRLVHLTIQPGLYLAIAGLVGIIVAGIIRVIIASIQPADS